VTDRESVPVTLFAISVYVLVPFGETVWLPLAPTVPALASIKISVAFSTDHRKTADCPRAMERGSAVKLLIRGGNVSWGGGMRTSTFA
jgi:hypothetical protein